jgi:hypothetical protein
MSVGLLSSCTPEDEARANVPSTAEQIQQILADEEALLASQGYSPSEVPAGYNQYSGDNSVAWKWLSTSSVSCSYGDYCLAMSVITKFGCDTLYVEVAEFDKYDNQVGYNNEMLSGLAPNQKAKLVFEGFAPYMSLTEIRCSSW